MATSYVSGFLPAGACTSFRPYPQAYTHTASPQLRSLRRAPGRLDHRPVHIVGYWAPAVAMSSSRACYGAFELPTCCLQRDTSEEALWPWSGPLGEAPPAGEASCSTPRRRGNFVLLLQEELTFLALSSLPSSLRAAICPSSFAPSPSVLPGSNEASSSILLTSSIKNVPGSSP